MDIHAAIRAFLQQHETLPHEGEGDFTKSGVVPFLRAPMRYYLMKPRARIPELEAPPFQLCKGTRMYFAPGIGWRDMQDAAPRENMETLAETALREGIEELGLKLENIARVIDMGPYDFSSATTGKPKRMWLFAAEMKSADDFLPERDVALTTAARGWLTLAEFAVAGREDHRYILQDMENRLSGE